MNRILLSITILLFQSTFYAQVMDWAIGMHGGSGSGTSGADITNDAFGNIYTIGGFDGTVDFDPGPGVFNLGPTASSSYIQKLDQNGNFIWAQEYDAYLKSIYVDDNSGDLYITGFFQGTTDFDPGPGVFNLTAPANGLIHQLDVFILKLDSLGDFKWAKSFGSATGDDNGAIVKMDNFSNVYVCGAFSNTIDFDLGPGVYNMSSNGWKDVFIMKLDTSGNFIWAKSFGGSIHSDAISGMDFNANGDLFCTGKYRGTVDFDPGSGIYNLSSVGNSYHDIFLLNLDSTGSFGWAKAIGGPWQDGGLDAKVDPSGNLYFTGYFSDTCDFDPGSGVSKLVTNGGKDIFFLKLDPNGDFLWAKHIGGSFHDIGSSIDIDNSNNLFMLGRFSRTIDLDPGPGSNVVTPVGGYGDDICIVKLNSNGDYLWAGAIGSGEGDYGTAINIDNSGNIYSTGLYSDVADFDPGPAVHNLGAHSASSADWAVFILKLTQPLSTAIGDIDESQIKVFPNPMSDFCVIQSQDIINGSVVLYDSFGRILMEQSVVNSEQLTISRNHLPSGVYYLKLSNEKGQTLGVRKIVIE
ncbi:MAG: T9SS type A sorting domain-containing protein [Flavobacteriales bacterium]|nr:T9SS type A sorting domain-containing protein [Flavobacteriales bacterium]